MIIYDFECFRYDWMICWIDCKTHKMHHIVNDKAKFEKFYEYYKDEIWVGYGSRNYDIWIAKAILCDFNPYEMSDWIINKDRKGFEFSKLLNNFPILNYDCIYGFRSLKECEAFMGHDIRETSVPFDIDRPLTLAEIQSTLEYCRHDVNETLEVFVETKEEFESHIGLIKEFELPLSNINKTKAQISAIILGATKRQRNDEFDISIPDTIDLGKYGWIKDFYYDWASNSQNYDEMALTTEIGDISHTFGIGGLHGSTDNYIGDGHYLMADVSSYYPALMIEYDFLSRNVENPRKYKAIRDERLLMKAKKDKREKPRKIVLNATFGACKDQYNALYDPLQSNNVCIAGQLMLVDLIDKLQNKCELIQTNTDGILVKLFWESDKDEIIGICKEWGKRVRMDMEYEDYTRVIQKDVNNYIILPKGELYDSKGKERFKRKGAFVKQLSRLDNDLPIVNRAVMNYFLYNIPVEDTVMASKELIDFQKITKVSSKYEYASHNGKILHEKVHRCFASKDSNDGTLYKKHRNKDTLDKTPSTPVNCFIDNSNIETKPIPAKLDKQWYIDLAKERVKAFIG